MPIGYLNNAIAMAVIQALARNIISGATQAWFEFRELTTIKLPFLIFSNRLYINKF